VTGVEPCARPNGCDQRTCRRIAAPWRPSRLETLLIGEDGQVAQALLRLRQDRDLSSATTHAERELAVRSLPA
jgi:hypothetical protein